MRTQLSMFDATTITIEEKRGDDEPNETIWTDITVRSGEGDVIEFTVFDCPPIRVGKDGALCEDVLRDIERSDPASRAQLRADYRTEVLRSQDRLNRAKAAEQACTQLRIRVDSLVSQLETAKDDLSSAVEHGFFLDGQLADAQAAARGDA